MLLLNLVICQLLAGSKQAILLCCGYIGICPDSPFLCIFPSVLTSTASSNGSGAPLWALARPPRRHVLTPVPCDVFQDFFFYSLVYDPQQKTLLADKGEIRVGNRYQADITDLLKEGRTGRPQPRAQGGWGWPGACAGVVLEVGGGSQRPHPGGPRHEAIPGTGRSFSLAVVVFVTSLKLFFSSQTFVGWTCPFG